jgi:hypothetical protein
VHRRGTRRRRAPATRGTLVRAVLTLRRLEMRGLASRGRTENEVLEITYDRGLSRDRFTLRTPERGRP